MTTGNLISNLKTSMQKRRIPKPPSPRGTFSLNSMLLIKKIQIMEPNKLKSPDHFSRKLVVGKTREVHG